MRYETIKFNSTEEWKQCRAEGIGGSEVGILFGANDWCTPRELAERKKNERNGIFSNYTSEAAERGKDIEPGVVSMWERKTGLKSIKNTSGDWIARDKERPWLQASPDRMYFIGNKKNGERGILECKTTACKVDSESVPTSWVFQTMYYMGITGCKEAYIAWYGYNYTSGYIKVQFDERLFELICEQVTKFWHDCILGDIIPAAINGDEICKEYPQSDPSKEKQIDSDVLPKLERLSKVKAQIKELEAEEDSITNQVKAMCDDSERYIINGDVAWTYKTSKDSTSFDKDALMRDHPDIYKQYCVTKPGTRRLSIKI